MSRRSPKLTPEVANALEAFRPQRLTPAEAAEVPVVLPVVRAWVALAAPASAYAARQMMWATTRHTIWANLTIGTLDEKIVLSRHNVEHFVTEVKRDQGRGWRHAVRSALYRVARAANPDGWDPPIPAVGRRKVPPAYSPQQEGLYAFDAMLPGRRNRGARMFVVAATIGTGMTGKEASLVGPQHIDALPGGYLAIRVQGKHPRRVPVRPEYTELLRGAMSETDGERFVIADNRNSVTTIAAGLKADGNSMSLRRARNTWIVANLAETPPDTLWLWAGSLGSDTLDALLASTRVDPDEAIRMWLRRRGA